MATPAPTPNQDPTQQQPQTDPYAEFGGQVGSPSSAAPTDPYAEFGGQVAAPPTAPVSDTPPTGVAGLARGYYDMGIKPLKEIAGQLYTDIGQTLSPNQDEKAATEAQANAAEQHKMEVYHKASADFHKGIATRNVTSILQAGKDLAELFTNDYNGSNPNDVVGNIATAAIRGAQQENDQVAQHATNVVAAVKKAAELHRAGDTAGALRELKQVIPEGIQTVSHQLAEAIPLVGPAAEKAISDYDAGHKAYAVGEAGALLTPEIVKGVKETGLIGKTIDATKNAADTLKNSPLGQKLGDAGVPGFNPDATTVADVKSGVGDTIQSAKDAFGNIIDRGRSVVNDAGAAVARKAGSAAMTGALNFGAGIVDSVSNAIKDKISGVSDSAADAVKTLGDIRDAATQSLTDAGLHPDQVKSAVNDLMSKVQDKYAEWKNPPVSGGSPDAAPDPSAGIKATVTDWVNNNSTINSIKDFMSSSPIDPDQLSSVLQKNGVDPQASFGLAKAIFNRAAKIRTDSASPTVPQSTVLGGVAGAVAGKAAHAVSPGIGIGAAIGSVLGPADALGKAAFEVLHEAGYNGPIMKTASAITDAANGVFPIPEGKTAIARAAAIDPELAKVVTPGQMGGGTLLDVEKYTRKHGMGIGSYIADKYDAPARAGAEASLDRAIGRINPETADATQAERIAPLDAALKVSTNVPEETAAELKSAGYSDEEIAKAAQSKDLGNAFVRMGLTDSFGKSLEADLAFSRMKNMSDAGFNNLLAKVKDSPNVVEGVRQGYARYLADTTKDPTTGAYHLGKMADLIEENAGKFGQHYGDFRTIGKGLAELEDHMSLTNTKSTSLMVATIGGLATASFTALFGGHAFIPVIASELAGALAWNYLGPSAVDWLMKPRNLSDVNMLFRAAAKAPEGSANKVMSKLATEAKNVKKGFGTVVANAIKAQASKLNNESGSAQIPFTGKWDWNPAKTADEAAKNMSAQREAIYKQTGPGSTFRKPVDMNPAKKLPSVGGGSTDTQNLMTPQQVRSRMNTPNNSAADEIGNMIMASKGKLSPARMAAGQSSLIKNVETLAGKKKVTVKGDALGSPAVNAANADAPAPVAPTPDKTAPPTSTSEVPQNLFPELTPQVQDRMQELYTAAAPSFNTSSMNVEHSFTFNQFGNPGRISTSNQRNHNTITLYGNEKGIIHSHPLGDDPRPSGDDINVAKKAKIPNYVLSKNQLWVADPSGKTRQVATVTYKDGRINLQPIPAKKK